MNKTILLVIACVVTFVSTCVLTIVLKSDKK